MNITALNPWQMVILSAIIAQLCKYILYGFANRKLSLRILVTTNGLPSLHAVSFSCLTTVIGLVEGFRSAAFVASFILSGIVLHDAIRLQGSVEKGGRSALLVANALPGGLKTNLWAEQLRPLLGDRRHRPLHVVCGIVMGILLGLSWRNTGLN